LFNSELWNSTSM